MFPNFLKFLFLLCTVIKDSADENLELFFNLQCFINLIKIDESHGELVTLTP